MCIETLGVSKTKFLNQFLIFLVYVSDRLYSNCTNGVCVFEKSDLRNDLYLFINAEKNKSWKQS